MVAISAVRASNSAVRSTIGSSPTAVFAGSTEGIGYATMRAFVANTESPNIYFVGRSQQKGESVIQELKQVNDKAQYEFIAGEFTLLSDVDRMATIIIDKTSSTGIDYVCVSPGFLSLGRQETKEGLDRLMTIRYYSRLLFIHTLLSSLPPPKRPKHVLSVLAGTTEAPVLETDLSLSSPANYGKFLPCAAHTATFTSLAFEHLAKQYPDTAFVHSYPGLVKTGGVTGWIGNAWVRWLVEWTLLPLTTPFAVPVTEVGERGLFYLTSERFASREGKEGRGRGGNVRLVQGVEEAKGEGAYSVARYGDEGEGECMKGYRERGFGETVWKHSLWVFERALRKSV
ncbi:uncharacterized protein KY384_005602 [Bacidia gigantensis]|uniref:uncharacterized protein n=1 Tax=Bacidia gigantensis TaxID=2732470 RepID=UPI001D046CF5|nr:uncharacterized protein KY384_005602 [Bacidia gigantensis]KAG8530120.1 hypothetical protein KY384_005602 [Bacidia gigantensis]